VALAWQVAQLVPLYIAGPIARPTGPTLRVVSQNVFTHNTNYQAVFDLVEREDPDILFLIESNQRWQREMAPLEATYPFTLHIPSRSNFGLSVYAKEPWSAIEVARFGRAQLPSLVLHLDTPEGPVQLIATHTVPPINPNYSALRNEHLVELGEWIAASALPTLLVGDLNTTPWSPAFHDLVRAGYLQNTQRGYGISPTWTLHNLPGIPIDHALVTRGVAIGDRRTGPQIGSDHRAVIVDFAAAPGN
jgi:endonuclease/exonuclease/phosphatase (EEP) superfamily protein YafD